MDVAQEIEPLVYIMSYVFSSGVSFFVIFLQKKYSYILILLHKSPIKTFRNELKLIILFFIHYDC